MDYMLQFFKKGGIRLLFFRILLLLLFPKQVVGKKGIFATFSFRRNFICTLFPSWDSKQAQFNVLFTFVTISRKLYFCLTQLFTVQRVKFKKYHQNGMKIHFRCNFYDNIPRESLFYQRKYFQCFFHTLATKRVCCKVATILFYAFGP